MVHAFARSFSVELQKLVSATLKLWAGLYKSADVGTLYRSRKAFGMGLTSVTSHFERMQIIKCSLLKNSDDSVISSLYNQIEAREASFGKRWHPARLLSAAESEMKLNPLFTTQDSRAGLGSGNFTTSKPFLLRQEEIGGRIGRGLVGRRAHGSCFLLSFARGLD